MELIEIETNEWTFWEPTLTVEIDEQFDRALDIYDAGDYETAKALLRKIAMRCPNHIDAMHHLSLLYEEEGKSLECYVFCQAAVSIGLHAIPKRFRWDRGKIRWSDLRNRPFMRAYHSLGLCRMDQERWDDAIESLAKLLRVNPNDNQGTRYLLPKCWFEKNEISAILRHCRKYRNDIGPEILYSNALALILDGQLEEAKTALEDCVVDLPLISKELLKQRHPEPKSRYPGRVTVGGKDQAWVYWKEYGKYWENSEDAIALLRQVTQKRLS